MVNGPPHFTESTVFPRYGFILLSNLQRIKKRKNRVHLEGWMEAERGKRKENGRPRKASSQECQEGAEENQ